MDEIKEMIESEPGQEVRLEILGVEDGSQRMEEGLATKKFHEDVSHETRFLFGSD